MKMESHIQSFFHCAKCVQEDSRPNIAVGVIGSGTHLQVWCETQEQNHAH
jgi:hypothetical protein